MVPKSQPNGGFKRAADKFKASIPADLSNQFAQHSSSLDSLKDEIRTIQDDHGKKGSLRNLTRLKKFIEAMNQLGKVIEVFVNANDLVCFIWGPMKFVLGVAKTHLDNFDRLLDAYAQIGDVIPGLLFYQDMFREHEPLKDVLQDYYSDILKFHEEAIKVFVRSKWQDLFHATWKTFNTQFDPIMQSLKKRGELLESVKLSASLDQIHIIRRGINDVYQEQIRSASEEASARHQSRMMSIKEKLRAPEYFLDQEAATHIRAGLDTGRWVFEEPQYVSWSDKNTLGHSCLYINGIPGAGKTTLVSLIVGNLLEAQASNELPLTSVSYFYFKHGDSERNSHESVLRAILTQLIDQDATSSQEFYGELSKRADVNIRSRESLESLTKRAFEGYRASYLVLDGLDECEHEQAEHTVKWLLALLESDRYSGKTSLRVLFSGQRDGLLDKILADVPSISLESTKHDHDIETYCVQYASRLQKKFRLTKDLEGEIVSLVMKGAQGMFLYARVVLQYLLRQVSLSRLKKTLKPEIFPERLDTAYQRVAASIYEAEFESEMEAAKKIIALIIAAKRELRWREIQSFFCIDQKEGNIDPDERLLVDAKELCGSLVDVHQVNGRTGESESVVRIVHHTAQRYLIEKMLVNRCLENARLLTFCSEYLISPPFARSNRSDMVSSHARRAYYALQDYAVAHWYDHLQDLAQTDFLGQAQTPRFLQELESATHSTKQFLRQYITPLEDVEKMDSQHSLGAILRMLPLEGKDRTSMLDIERRTSWIRHEIENLNGVRGEERDILDSLYGSIFRFKCPKPTCFMFSEGFTTKSDRSNHVNRHNRQFQCGDEGCFRQGFGFESHEALEKHQREYHSEMPIALEFPRQHSHGQLANVPSDLRVAAQTGPLDLVERLIDEGADIDVVSPSGNPSHHDDYRTPIWWAVKFGKYDICKLLIDRGANIGKPIGFSQSRKNIKKVDTMSPCTPLAQACARGDIKMVDLILKAHVKAKSFTGSGIRIGLMKAVAKRNLEIVQMLTNVYSFSLGRDIEHGPDDPIKEACRNVDASTVEFLLEAGFELKDGRDYIELCVRYTDWNRHSKPGRLILNSLLSTGKPGMVNLSVLQSLLNAGQPSIVHQLLLYPKTNLSAGDLRVLRSPAEEHAYQDVITLIDELIAVNELEL